jgi:hypothetical protein
MVLNTPRSGGRSPWKIRVTVAAEPGAGSDDENMASPTVEHVTRTNTTTIPLKDADGSSPVKRRGRPRKSDVATSANAKRNGTPVRKRLQSQERDTSVGASDSAPKKRRGRPRKSIQPPKEDEQTLDIIEKVPTIQTTLATPQKDPTPQPIRQATSLMQPDEKTKGRNRRPFVEYEEPVVFTPPVTDLSQRLRARKGTPHTKKVVVEISSGEESDIDTPSDSDEDAPEPMITTGAEENEDDIEHVQEQEVEDDDVHNMTNYAFDEGTTRMPDDTTVMDSENFSMVSVDSLPSHRGLMKQVNRDVTAIPTDRNMADTLNQSYLEIPSVNAPNSLTIPQFSAETLSAPLLTPTEELQTNPMLSNSSRYQTPAVNSAPPSRPPSIEPADYCASEASTPEIGSAVKAGVALQGLMDPNRITPTPRSHAPGTDAQRDSLNDLFRGFSAGTRKELQAGLRLGEQLAAQKRSMPTSSSPVKPTSTASSDDVFFPQAKSPALRLPTPEEQDEDSSPPPPPVDHSEVHYPKLDAQKAGAQLISPARSDDELIGQVDAPLVAPATHNPSPVMPATSAPKGSQAANGSEKEVYEDIWQEEASRSSLPDHDGKHAPQMHDLLAFEGPIKPARGKLPRTWRRKNPSDFNYNDEAEEQVQEPTRSASKRSDWPISKTMPVSGSTVRTSPSEDSDEPTSTELDQGKGGVLQLPPVEEDHDMSDASDDTDTGMFFQSNLPNLYKGKQTGGRRSATRGEQNHSLLMENGQSLIPDSSPPSVKTPPQQQPHPFVNPPLLAALQSSPFKSSPLRQQARVSDTEDSFQQETFVEESSLPVLQSSPFHTNVEVSMVSAASDQQQFRQEMEGATDLSIRRVREEADAHAEAYESQYRTLNEIEEVTEHSRTLRSAVMLPGPSSSRIDHSLLSRERSYSAVFGQEQSTASANQQSLVTHLSARSPVIARTPRARSPPPAQAPGLFSRLTSGLWGVIGGSAPVQPTEPTTPHLSHSPQLPDKMHAPMSFINLPARSPLSKSPMRLRHPALAKFHPLPKIEPWTKTHYKTLDALYQMHKRDPYLFAPSPEETTSNRNNTLFEHFIQTQSSPFLGAIYSNWGYSATITAPLVVLCAVFMQLLTLDDVEAYERVSGRGIEMGECALPGEGEEEDEVRIGDFQVVARLASVVMGEDLRRDERRRVEIRRAGSVQIKWPH